MTQLHTHINLPTHQSTPFITPAIQTTVPVPTSHKKTPDRAIVGPFVKADSQRPERFIHHRNGLATTLQSPADSSLSWFLEKRAGSFSPWLLKEGTDGQSGRCKS